MYLFKGTQHLIDDVGSQYQNWLGNQSNYVKSEKSLLGGRKTENGSPAGFKSKKVQGNQGSYTSS